jgi:hypothetical protein
MSLFVGPYDRECGKCREVKPYAEFSPRGERDGVKVYKSTCKSCCAAHARAWFHANKEQHRITRHAHNLRAAYGLSVEKYAAMLAAQGGVCAICGLDEPNAHGRTGAKFRLSVDHCHESGRIRGLLCQKCNRAIGLLGDDIDLLRRAITYLGGS